MLQVNTTANLNNGMTIKTGMAINYIPYIENAGPTQDGKGVILPLGLSCYLDKDTAQNGIYKSVVPITDGSESIDKRSLYRTEIEYTNEEWNSPTGVNRDTMETKLIPVLEAWNKDWAGNIVKV